MIDFRYHLVSLISVFLALAVGIVLGAGPLNEPIARGLSQSVQQLRQDLDARNDQLKTAQAGIANRDTFLTQIEPGLVANQLGGRSVVVVTLPGFDADAVKPLTTALVASGAKVTGRVDVQSAWVDPNDASAREKAVQALSAGVGATTPSRSTPSASPSATRSGGSSASTPVVAAQLLARALVTSELSASEKTDATARTLLDGLTRAGLIEVTGDAPTRATQAVILVPGVAQALQGAASPSPSGSADPTQAWLTLARALDTNSTGAVVVGPASSSTAGGLISAVRGEAPVAGVLSTVDTGSTPMGDVTTVFALREQQLGRAGHYGFGDGAKAPLPVSASAG
jgi:Copper transport outer membrane protein, MctB